MSDPTTTSPASTGIESPEADSAGSEQFIASGDGGSGDDDLTKRLRNLWGNNRLDSIKTERDVSQVYIDRSQVNYHFAGAAPDAVRGAASPAQARNLASNSANWISAVEIEDILATFEPPNEYEVAQRLLRQNGVILLCGVAGGGKRAAAIHLCAQLRGADGNRALCELSPDLRLVDLSLDDIPNCSGIVLETPTGLALDGLIRTRMQSLRTALSERDSALVITCEHLPPAVEQDSRSLMVNWNPTWPQGHCEAQRQILARHLRRAGDRAGMAANDLEPALAALMEEAELVSTLSVPLEMKELADLAYYVFPVIQGNAELLPSLAQLRRRVDSEVRLWFEDGGRDLETKLLLVAAAVFNGALVEEVEDASKVLLQRLQPAAPVAKEPAVAVDPFQSGSRRSNRLNAIHAVQVETPVSGMHYGTATARVLQLRNPAWQRAVLDHVWEDVTPLREPMLEWLTTYGAGGNERLRSRAAAALGALARHSFPLIEARILRNWANAKSGAERRSAAQLLGITAWDDALSVTAMGLLRHWASSAQNPRLLATAAWACTGLAGLRFPQQTSAILQQIAGSAVKLPNLLEPISQAFLHQFASAQSAEQRLQLLQGLESLCAQNVAGADDPQRIFAEKRTALIVFWICFWPAQDDPVWRQMLCDAADKDAPAQSLTVSLIRHALHFRQPAGSVRDNVHPRRLAREGLRALIDQVHLERNRELTGALSSLFAGLAAAADIGDRADGTEDRAALRDYAQQWDDLPGDAQHFRKILL